MLAGMIAGGCVGVLVWTLFRPRRRLSRKVLILVVINGCARLLYLIAISRRSHAETEAIVRRQVEREAQRASGWPNGMTMMSDHPPSLLAARPLTWVSLPEKPLGLMAGPAVGFVQLQTVRDEHWQTGPSVSESYWIASVGFLVSTAWWVTAPAVFPWLIGKKLKGLFRRSLSRLPSA